MPTDYFSNYVSPNIIIVPTVSFINNNNLTNPNDVVNQNIVEVAQEKPEKESLDLVEDISEKTPVISKNETISTREVTIPKIINKTIEESVFQHIFHEEDRNNIDTGNNDVLKNTATINAVSLNQQVPQKEVKKTLISENVKSLKASTSWAANYLQSIGKQNVTLIKPNLLTASNHAKPPAQNMTNNIKINLKARTKECEDENTNINNPSHIDKSSSEIVSRHKELLLSSQTVILCNENTEYKLNTGEVSKNGNIGQILNNPVSGVNGNSTFKLNGSSAIGFTTTSQILNKDKLTLSKNLRVNERNVGDRESKSIACEKTKQVKSINRDELKALSKIYTKEKSPAKYKETTNLKHRSKVNDTKNECSSINMSDNCNTEIGNIPKKVKVSVKSNVNNKKHPNDCTQNLKNPKHAQKRDNTRINNEIPKKDNIPSKIVKVIDSDNALEPSPKKRKRRELDNKFTCRISESANNQNFTINKSKNEYIPHFSRTKNCYTDSLKSINLPLDHINTRKRKYCHPDFNDQDLQKEASREISKEKRLRNNYHSSYPTTSTHKLSDKHPRIKPPQHNSDEDNESAFDLRSKLSRLNKYTHPLKTPQLQCKNHLENESEKIRENLLITVNNDEKPMNTTTLDESKSKPKALKFKKIKLIINVLCQDSEEDSESSSSNDSENGHIINTTRSDLSFLDDINIDEIVNSLKSSPKINTIPKAQKVNDMRNLKDLKVIPVKPTKIKKEFNEENVKSGEQTSHNVIVCKEPIKTSNDSDKSSSKICENLHNVKELGSVKVTNSTLDGEKMKREDETNRSDYAIDDMKKVMNDTPRDQCINIVAEKIKEENMIRNAKNLKTDVVTGDIDSVSKNLDTHIIEPTIGMSFVSRDATKILNDCNIVNEANVSVPSSVCNTKNNNGNIINCNDIIIIDLTTDELELSKETSKHEDQTLHTRSFIKNDDPGKNLEDDKITIDSNSNVKNRNNVETYSGYPKPLNKEDNIKNTKTGKEPTATTTQKTWKDIEVVEQNIQVIDLTTDELLYTKQNDSQENRDRLNVEKENDKIVKKEITSEIVCTKENNVNSSICVELSIEPNSKAEGFKDYNRSIDIYKEVNISTNSGIDNKSVKDSKSGIEKNVVKKSHDNFIASNGNQEEKCKANETPTVVTERGNKVVQTKENQQLADVGEKTTSYQLHCVHVTDNQRGTSVTIKNYAELQNHLTDKENTVDQVKTKETVITNEDNVPKENVNKEIISTNTEEENTFTESIQVQLKCPSNEKEKPEIKTNVARNVVCTEMKNKTESIYVKPNRDSSPSQNKITDIENRKCDDPKGHIKITVPKAELNLANQIDKRIFEYMHKKICVTSLIRKGKYSKVFKCNGPRGENYALKVITNGDRVTLGVVKEDMLKSLQQDIPKENLNVVYLINGFSINTTWGLLMEYYPQNMDEVLKKQGALHIDTVQDLSKQLVTALMWLKHHKIVHADIKPHHLLLDESVQNLKLCGFDQAYHNSSITREDILPNIGSLLYRAPEVILGHSISYSIDVWSCAVTMYEMATNMKLLTGMYNNQILFGQLVLLGPVPVDIIAKSKFASSHFIGSSFMKRFGWRGENFVFHDNFKRKMGQIKQNMLNVYYGRWGKTAKKKRYEGRTKLLSMCVLLDQMLNMDPRQRIAIEFACTHPFIYETAS